MATSMLKHFVIGYLVLVIIGVIVIIIGSSKIGSGTLFEHLANIIDRWTNRGIVLCLALLWIELFLLIYMAINDLFIY